MFLENVVILADDQRPFLACPSLGEGTNDCCFGDFFLAH